MRGILPVAPILRGLQIGLRHYVLGANYLYKLLPAESAADLAFFEALIEPGVGALPHRHADERLGSKTS